MLTVKPLLKGPAVDLYIWGNAESCVTIVAACIPILRVFVRDVKTSAARYYLSNSRTNPHTTTHQSKVRDNINTITITAGAERRDDESASQDDDERRLTRDNGKIMQTKEVAIEYQDNRSWTDEHELDDLRRSHKSL